MADTFEQKLINISFALSQPGATFTGSSGNSISLTGLRVHSTVEIHGGVGMDTMEADIYGMSLSEMNDLTMKMGNVPMNYAKNKVTLYAGDKAIGMWQVFSGDVNNAYANFTNMPDVPFHVSATGSGDIQAAPVQPTSYKGPTPVATILQKMAGQAGYKFENNGVTAQLVNPYFHGTLREQMMACVEAAGCHWNALENQTLAVWPSSKSRGDTGIAVNKDTGMVTAPAYTNKGILVKTLFNPQIVYGKTIQVTSEYVPIINGSWKVMSIDYALDSMVFGGQWFMTIFASDPDYVTANTV